MPGHRDGRARSSRWLRARIRGASVELRPGSLSEVSPDSATFVCAESNLPADFAHVRYASATVAGRAATKLGIPAGAAVGHDPSRG